MRPDIPPRLFRDLLLKATEVVQQRLLAAAKPETQAEIRRVLAQGVERGRHAPTSRDYSAAQHRSRRFAKQGKLDEAALVDFAKTGQYEETVVGAVAAVRGADRRGGSADGRRPARSDPDPVQVGRLGMADRQGAIIGAAGRQGRTSTQALDTAFANFERLSPATAQRVMRFWQARPAAVATMPLSSLSAAERSDSRARGPRAWPWPRSASR